MARTYTTATGTNRIVFPAKANAGRRGHRSAMRIETGLRFLAPLILAAALGYASSILPGPEAQQIAPLTDWHGNVAVSQ